MYEISDKAAAVREIQRFLNELHYEGGRIPPLRIDGYYGEVTRRAVRAFQAELGLPASGAVDSATYKALYKEYRRAHLARTSSHFAPPDLRLPATLGASGEGVLMLQRMMNTLAERYRLPIRTDQSGVFSYSTRALADAIGRIYRIRNDGSVTGELYDKMLRDYRYPVGIRE